MRHDTTDAHRPKRSLLAGFDEGWVWAIQLAAAQSQVRPDESKTGYRDPSIVPDSLVALNLQRLQFLNSAQSLASMVRFGGVGGFFSFPSVQVRKCRPASGFFASRQTFMPEFDQSPFYIDRSRRHR